MAEFYFSLFSITYTNNNNTGGLIDSEVGTSVLVLVLAWGFWIGEDLASSAYVGRGVFLLHNCLHIMR